MNRFLKGILALVFFSAGSFFVEHLWNLLGILVFLTPVVILFMLAWSFFKEAVTGSDND